jgi:hypothetical protein
MDRTPVSLNSVQEDWNSPSEVSTVSGSLRSSGVQAAKTTATFIKRNVVNLSGNRTKNNL